MNIENAPATGVYLQVGAITMLVVEFLDVNTGLPIQLQTATDLTLSILYPDGVTARDLVAELYTDGSDGMICYTTQNDGASNIDLTQVGLYLVQGFASIGGQRIPPTELTDFYCLPNVGDIGAPPLAYTSSALIFFDANNVRWAMTVGTGGALTATARLTGPSNSLTLNQVVLQDSDGVYWTITMGTDGTYVATVGGTYEQSIDNLVLLDAVSRAWVVTVSTAGVLLTA